MSSISTLRPAAVPPESPSRGPARRRLIAAAVIAVALVVVGVWVVAFSPLLGVRTITVKGVDGPGAAYVSADKVRAAAGVAHGSPLVRLDTAGIARRVERIPAVASAEVTTSLPSTVTITITERVAVAYTQDGSHLTLIDRTGRQFRTVTKAPSHLPHFILPSGARARSTAAALATVARALPTRLRAKVVTIQALDPTSISLSLRNDVTVQWGSARQSPEKARILPALLKRHPNRVDVSDPGRPFTH